MGRAPAATDLFLKKGKVVKNLMKLEFGGNGGKTSEDGESGSETESAAKTSNKGSRKASKILDGDVLKLSKEKPKKLTAKDLLGEEALSPLVRGLLSAAKEDDNEEILQELSAMTESTTTKNEKTTTQKFSEGLSSSGGSTDRTEGTETSQDKNRKQKAGSGKVRIMSSPQKSTRGSSASSGSQSSNNKDQSRRKVASASARLSTRPGSQRKLTSAKVSIVEPPCTLRKSSGLQTEKAGMRRKSSVSVADKAAKGRKLSSAKNR